MTGTSIAFTVEATGDELQFLWQKDGKDIDKNESRLQCSQTDSTSTLHIQHVKKGDQRHYKCLVRNPAKENETILDVAQLTVCEFVCAISHRFSTHVCMSQMAGIRTHLSSYLCCWCCLQVGVECGCKTVWVRCNLYLSSECMFV